MLFILTTQQSISLPLQGFFNAIVYGWTQEDFVEVVGNTDLPDESAALIQNLPIDIEQSINNEEEYHSPANGYDETLTGSKSVAFRQSLVISESKLGDITDYHTETEDELSLDASNSVSVHRV